MTTTSTSIGELAKALAAAQAEMTNASKDAKNPHFRSEYATLASVREATVPCLARHGIAVIQSPGSDGDAVTVSTRLVHASGEWVESTVGVRPTKGDAQGVGSVITYLRRYALAAMCGVAQEDDDGESGVGRPRSSQGAPRVSPLPDAPLPGVSVSDADIGKMREGLMLCQTLGGLEQVAGKIQAAFGGEPAPLPTGLSQLYHKCKREIQAAADLNVSIGTFRAELEALRKEGVEKPTKAHVRKRMEGAS